MDSKNYHGEEFNRFIKELIDQDRLNDSKETGIAKLVIDKGFESLSDKQKFTFTNSISEYVYDNCLRCGNEIPWEEMSGAEDNGGMCGWCQQLSRDDD